VRILLPIVSIAALLVAACASFDGYNLTPGQSTAEDV